MRRYLVLLSLLFATLALGSDTTLTGRPRFPGGGVPAGYTLTLYNPYTARDTTTNTLILPHPVAIRLDATGAIPSSPVVHVPDVATLAPGNTFYRATFTDPYGNTTTWGNLVIAGATLDIGTLTPSPISPPNFWVGLDAQLIKGKPVATPTVAGTLPTFNGTSIAWQLKPSLDARDYYGLDCGAKIVSAFTTLFGVPGSVVVPPDCSALGFSTPVTVPARSRLQILPVATINQTASITVLQGGVLDCNRAAMNDGASTTYSGVTFFQPNATNLPKMFIMSGDASATNGCTLDGNRSNNINTVGVAITGKRVSLSSMNVYNVPGDGITVTSTNENLEAGGAALDNVNVSRVGGRGLYCTHSPDLKVINSEFELGGNVGMELYGCNSPRLTMIDFGSNNVNAQGVAGLYVHGIAGGTGVLLGRYGTAVNLQFGNNVGHDFYIDGNDGGTRTVAEWTITNAMFVGLGGAAPNNTYDALHIQDSGNHTVSGTIIQSNAGHTYRYGMRTLSVGPGELADNFGTNVVVGTYGTAAVSLISSAVLGCNIFNESYCQLDNTYWGNARNFNAKNSAGTIQSLFTPLDASDDTIFNNLNAGKIYSFQINGAEGLRVSSTGIITPVACLATGICWTTGAGAPGGACSNGSIYTDSTAGKLYACEATIWVAK